MNLFLQRRLAEQVVEQRYVELTTIPYKIRSTDLFEPIAVVNFAGAPALPCPCYITHNSLLIDPDFAAFVGGMGYPSFQFQHLANH